MREAITLAFDFNWMNKALYYNAYQRADSYFQNTAYAARGYPDAAELALLAPLKGQVPPEVFTSIHQPPASDGSGNDRQNLLKATQLLKEAGWVVKNQKLVNAKTGQPFAFELMLLSGSNFQYVLPFRHNLQRLGIDMAIREIDASQYTRRMRERDFDMMPTVYMAMPFPTANLRIIWDSGTSTPAITPPASKTRRSTAWSGKSLSIRETKSAAAARPRVGSGVDLEPLHAADVVLQPRSLRLLGQVLHAADPPGLCDRLR